jgi:hypothetical protein
MQIIMLSNVRIILLEKNVPGLLTDLKIAGEVI